MSDIINPNESLPGDVSPTSKIEALPDVGDEHAELANKGASFAALMENKPMQPTAELSPKVQGVSPFDLAGIGAKPIASPSLDSLINQANLAHGTLSTVQNQLSYPNLKLKPSQKYLVKNKLVDANNHLRAANAKLGVSPENIPEPVKTSGTGPIAQYLGYVSDGMNQLEQAKRQLSAISAGGANLAPADFMLLQLKFNKAQQELDFTSAVLAKSIEGFKTIMGVQI